MNSNTAAIDALAADYRESLVAFATLRVVADDETLDAISDSSRVMARALAAAGRRDLARSIAYDVNVLNNR